MVEFHAKAWNLNVRIPAATRLNCSKETQQQHLPVPGWGHRETLHMSRLTTVLCLAPALLLFFGGCVTAGRARDVELKSMAASFTSDRGVFKLSLDVENPQRDEAELRGVSWEVWLNGRWFASGTQALAIPLAALERRTVELALPVAFRRVTILPGPTSLEMAVRGKLRLEKGRNVRVLPFESSSRIVADGAPEREDLQREE